MKKIISILLSLLIMVDILAFTFVRVAKKEFRPTYIRKIVTKIEVDEGLGKQIMDKISFTDIIKEALGFLGISDKTFDKIANSEGTKDFIGIYVANATSYLLGSDEEIPITKEDIKNLINKNVPIIKEEMPSWGKDFIEKNKESVDKYIDKHGDDIISLLPKAKDLMHDVKQEEIIVYKSLTLKDVTNVIVTVTNPQTSYLLIGGAVILLMILIILNLKAKKWAKYIFVISTIYALLLLVAKFVVMPIINNFSKDMSSLQEVIPYILSSITSTLWIFFFSSAIISILSILFYKINFTKKETAL